MEVPAPDTVDTPPSLLDDPSDFDFLVPTSPTEPEEPVLPLRHSVYYFEDGTATFLVGGYLFKIHRHFLARDSVKFRSMMQSCQDTIDLPEVTLKQFVCLLDFFYEGMYHDYKAPLFDWAAILSIATRFGFQRVRERAIIEMNSAGFQHELGPVQKIVWAKEYDVRDWLPACYEALCQRKAGLEDSEADKLGIATTNRIWKAREAVRAACSEAVSCSAVVLPHSNYAEEPRESSSEWGHRTYDASTVTWVVQDIFDLRPLTGKRSKKMKGRLKKRPLVIPELEEQKRCEESACVEDDPLRAEAERLEDVTVDLALKHVF